MNRLKRMFYALMGTVGLLGLSVESQAIAVDTELVLAVDVSTSVSATEFNLQRQGYIDAFNSAVIADAISNGTIGSIAVTLVYWATDQVQSVAWTQIGGGGGTAADFAALVAGAGRPPINGAGGVGCCTGIGDAISFSQGLFANGFEGTRNVIDVSGDGTNNSGGSVTAARDAAVGTGTIINGIAIGNASLLSYYEDNIIGGTGSFALQATDFTTFGAGIQTKLLQEIIGTNPVPVPGSLFLVGLGLVGLAGAGRRRARA